MTTLDPNRLLFIVGCPRSGTTWTQILLAHHPKTTTGRETHLFDRYLGPIWAAHQAEISDGSEDGLKAYLNSAEVGEQLLKPFADTVMSKLAAGARAGALVIEKTPSHVLWIDLIAALFPGARFLHVLRDPRGVAASWRAAATEPWGDWADRPTKDVADLWLRCAAIRRRSSSRLGGKYRELRFEDLHADPVAETTALYRWLDLPNAATEAKRAVRASTLAKLKAQAPTTLNRRDPRHDARPGFFRSGDPDAWRSELNDEAIRILEDRCGEAMESLGYAPIFEAQRAARSAPRRGDGRRGGRAAAGQQSSPVARLRETRERKRVR